MAARSSSRRVTQPEANGSDSPRTAAVADAALTARPPVRSNHLAAG
ncbi:hypothetical protein I551_8968, partial [Mycobacterium ulcerans str. Harvey]